MRCAALLSLVALSACTATLDRAVGRNVSVSPMLATDCRAQCDKLQMRLAAVVVTSAVGACVCEPLPAPASTPAPASPSPASPPPESPHASAAGPAAALALAAEEAEEERHREEAH
jgi:hypothetical protein